MHELEEVLQRIEENLDKELDLRTLCNGLSFSQTSLQRFFPILFNLTVSDYTRKRRLTLAAFELKQSSKSILEIALKYGYESPDSFTVAFKKHHNHTPTEVRNGASINVFRALKMNLSIEGGESLPVEIKTIPSFYVAGKAIETSVNHPDISVLWDEVNHSDYLDELIELSTKKSFGVCSELAETGKIQYIAGWEVSHIDKVKHLPVDTFKVKESTFAIIPCKGEIPESIHKAWQYVYSGECDLEFYKEGDVTSSDYQMEIWVPVKKVT